MGRETVGRKEPGHRRDIWRLSKLETCLKLQSSYRMGLDDTKARSSGGDGGSESTYGFESHEFHASAAQKEKMVQTMSEAGEVPSRFIRTAELERGWTQGSQDMDASVPVIDLSGWTSGEDRDRVRGEVARACEEWGFFQVVNHGMPESAVEAALKVAEDFFLQPFDVKQEVAIRPGEYQGYGRVFEHAGAPSDWVDVLGHYLIPESMKKVETQWPRNPASYRQVIEEYSRGIQHVAKQVLEMVSLSLGLPGPYFQDAFGPEHIASLRINYYPACPRAEAVLGLSPHSDGGYLTVLAQSPGVAGLEVRHHGVWLPVEPVPGALVLNVADMLEVASNGKYKSVEHRAVVDKARSRVSLATFFQPALDVVVKPADGSSPGPARYRSVLFSDYVALYFGKKLDGKANIHTLRVPVRDQDPGPGG